MVNLPHVMAGEIGLDVRDAIHYNDKTLKLCH